LNKKERAENLMIVDLVRNDLSRSCTPGTVKVPELCKVFTLKTVHQMCSTICGELKTPLHPLDALLAAFPMGSMTGAPKISAMKIIDELETFQRGIFSGSVGYFTPQGDFDLNKRLCVQAVRSPTIQMPNMSGGSV
jgi:para-aminobenzoate synthetase component 1